MKHGMAWMLAFAIGAAAPALADHHEGKGDGGGMHKRMAKKLDLTQAQQDQLKKLGKEHHEAVQPLRKQAREQMESLRGLLDKKASDSELASALTTLKQTRKSLQAAEEKHRDAMHAVLTPTQQAKMVLRMGKRMGKDWKKHQERGEGMGKDDGDEDDD